MCRLEKVRLFNRGNFLQITRKACTAGFAKLPLLISCALLAACSNTPEPVQYLPGRVIYRIDSSRFFEIDQTTLKLCNGSAPSIADSGDMVYYTDTQLGIHSPVARFGSFNGITVRGKGAPLMIDAANSNYLAIPIVRPPSFSNGGGGLPRLYFSQDAGRTWLRVTAPMYLENPDGTWLTGSILSVEGPLLFGAAQIDISLNYESLKDNSPYSRLSYPQRWQRTENRLTPGYFEPPRQAPIDDRFNCATGDKP